MGVDDVLGISERSGFADERIRGGELLSDQHYGGEYPAGRVEPPLPQRTVVPTPIVTRALVGVCVLVFLGMLASGLSLTAPKIGQLVHWGANFGPFTVRGQWWRLVTSAFVHIGLLHLLFNMWCLWNLGALAEAVFGRLKYLTVYMACAVVSAINSLVWHPLVVSAGASGAIFGLAGAMLTVFYLRKVPLPPAALRPVTRSLLTFAGYNLLFGALVPGIDNAAHIGGLICGCAIGVLMPKRRAVPQAAGPR
jgi:rhomboid protease GluP